MSGGRQQTQQQHHFQGRGGRGGHRSAPPSDRPKREAIIDLNKYQDQEIRVKLNGGREITGILKGFDQLMNLVLDDVHEFLRDPESGELSDKTRELGLVVVRGPLLTLIAPEEGAEEIPNPFTVAAES